VVADFLQRHLLPDALPRPGRHAAPLRRLPDAVRRLQCGRVRGGFFFGFAQVYFFLFVVLPVMRGQGQKAPQRPWDGAEGLEWEIPSPAPFHTFENPPKLDATATQVIG
jgi:heme/copper-type cytochrome/quinol oxidase subunit 1